MSDQDQRMRAVLARLELVSHGTCQAWNPSGGHSGEPDDKIVTLILRGEGDTPHERYLELYRAAWGPEAREKVIRAAEAEWAQWTGRDEERRKEKRLAGSVSLEDQIIEKGEGWDPRTVGQRFNVDQAFVRRLRAKRGRGLEDGRDVQVTPEASAERALELRLRGQSTRQIALTLGVHQTQVMRWIRRAA